MVLVVLVMWGDFEPSKGKVVLVLVWGYIYSSVGEMAVHNILTHMCMARVK